MVYHKFCHELYWGECIILGKYNIGQMRFAPTIIPHIRTGVSHTPLCIHPKLYYYNITCNVFLVGSLAWLLLQNTKLLTKKISLPYLWARRFDVLTKHFAVWLLLYKGSYTRRCVVVYLYNIAARHQCRHIHCGFIAYTFLLKHYTVGGIYLHGVGSFLAYCYLQVLGSWVWRYAEQLTGRHCYHPTFVGFVTARS